MSEEGDKLLLAADKKASSKSGLFGFMSRAEQKFEDAVEMCQEAANLFKMKKKWDRAADAYFQAAKYQEILKSNHEAAACYIEAAKMIKKVDAKSAIDPLDKAMSTFATLSRFNFSSKYALEIGELYEKEVVDMDKALEYYEKAADYAQMDGSESSSNKAYIRVAALAATTEKYARAIELYEQVADTMVDNNLLKFSCKEYYLKAGLCTLASGDIVGAKVKHERYESQAAYFRDSREAKLVANLAEAMENEDAEEFTQIIKEYDAVSKLDPWMTQILLKLKKSLAGEDLL
eukprot:m.169314 g.169314  ORF g.169314 m.169314 type:complete len:290 (-) comp18241_c0_seq2:229-1098(-)